MGIYSRLYKYRDTASMSPAENYLTEALADLFNRLPQPTKVEFLVRMLPPSCSIQLRNTCKDRKKIEAETQVSIVVGNSVKRPDMIVYLDGKPLILFEVKINAALQMHEAGSEEMEEQLQISATEPVLQSQLKTYSDWMKLQGSGDWPGAVVFLTHGTRAPKGFQNERRESTSVIGATRTWKDVGSWLAKGLAHGEFKVTARLHPTSPISWRKRAS